MSKLYWGDYKKILLLSTSLIGIFVLSGCSDTTNKSTQTKNVQDSSAINTGTIP